MIDIREVVAGLSGSATQWRDSNPGRTSRRMAELGTPNDINKLYDLLNFLYNLIQFSYRSRWF